MKLSTKSEYACLALITLSKAHEKDELYTILQIANENNIPKKYLEQILLILKRAGLLKSYKGPSGGYKLSRNPETITLAEVIRLMDGALAPVESVSKYFYEETPIEKSTKLLAVMKSIRDYISDTLENITFADLIE